MDTAAKWRFAESESRRMVSLAEDLGRITRSADLDAMRRKLSEMFGTMNQIESIYESLDTSATAI